MQHVKCSIDINVDLQLEFKFLIVLTYEILQIMYVILVAPNNVLIP